MANLIYINENELINAPNINLLPQFAMFNDVFTWNVVSGTATATNLNQEQLEGNRCLRIVPNISVGALVNSGGSQMQTTVSADGNYIFSIKHKCSFPTLGTQQVTVKIYVNAVATDYTFTATATNNNVYRTYYQIIPNLVAGDVIDFAFEFGTNDIAGSYKNYFDAPKLEIDSFGFGIPTVFSQPQQIVIDVTETIDVPSIGSNDSYQVDINVTGAEIGDFVQLTYPTTILDDTLVVGLPIVSDTDIVSFILHNHTGGSVDTASGDYSVKIVK